jgi:predicted MPP superfamily phosphohydrolase
LGQVTVLSKVKNDPQTLRHWRREEIDNLADTGTDLFHGAYPKLLARVPGNQSLQLCVDHKQIALPRLHPSHAGLRIAHISDFHMTGRLDRAWFDMVVREINRLEADVIAITGDIVENEVCLPWLAETLCQLEARLGIYFILGNHDKFVDTTRTRDILTEASHICLSGRWLQAEWNSAPVVLAGNERPWLAELGDLKNAPSRRADNLPLRLLLMHTPDQIDWARRHDADLVLAGHTHGGQICFPILGAVACPSIHGTRYTDGVYREGTTIMHVTRGLSGKRPLRWLCPPEIALLELAK